MTEYCLNYHLETTVFVARFMAFKEKIINQTQ